MEKNNIEGNMHYNEQFDVINMHERVTKHTPVGPLLGSAK